MAVNEDKCIESLVLSRGGDLTFYGKITQESLHILGHQIIRTFAGNKMNLQNERSHIR